MLETVDSEAVKSVLERLKEYDLSLLVKSKQKAAYSGFTTHLLEDTRGRCTSIMDPSRLSPKLLDSLHKEAFDLVVIPFRDKPNWQDSHAEALARELSNRLLIQPFDRQGQFYEGEDIHRILYNKSYLSSMFRFVPSLDGKNILDVGCSDGLVADLLMLENPSAITGIDVLETVGQNYPNEKITYHQMDATKMDFAENSFDVCLSIATLEHVADPSKALAEMKRVVQPGGYIYVQAGPLYFSPFGHHMFGFFDDYPWIHLRLTKEEIIKYCDRKGINEEIRKAVNKSADEHIDSMLNDAHINGKKFQEYNLSEFMSDPDIEVLYFNQSYEGQDLLTEEIQEQVKPISRDDLLAHGFELAVKVK